MATRAVKQTGVLSGLHIDEPDPQLPELSYLGEGWVPDSWDIPTHAHAVWEVYWQVDRSSEWSGEGRTFLLEAGDLLLSPPGRKHGLVNRPTGKFHFIAVGFGVAPLKVRLPEIAAAFTGIDAVRVVREAAAMEAPLRELVRESRLQLRHRSLGLRMAFDRFVLELTRLLRPQPVRALVPMHEAILRAKALIDGRCDRPWSLAQLARSACLSPCYFADLFTREVGEPPRQYLLRRRVERACHLLAHGDETVTSIAMTLGFSSSQHFARVFRAGVGCTASAYRARFLVGSTPAG